VRGVYLRQIFYRQTLAECGRDIYFGWQSVFSKPSARIGDNVYIGRRCSVGWADIGTGSMLADGVQILSGGRQHGRAPSASHRHQDQPQEFRRVTIGSGAWLGTNAVIMADVGAGTIVGAGAVVNRPLPPHKVATGVPARVIKELGEPSAKQ
jgi:acetyltransferase-like isoleucine patch superfamily enzyme